MPSSQAAAPQALLILLRKGEVLNERARSNVRARDTGCGDRSAGRCLRRKEPRAEAVEPTDTASSRTEFPAHRATRGGPRPHQVAFDQLRELRRPLLDELKRALGA